MKTITAFVVLLCMSFCLVNSEERVTKYGHQTTTEIKDTQTFVVKAKEGEIQRVNFEYPPGGELSKMPIVGIVHTDRAAKPVKIRFNNPGTVFLRKFSVSLESEPGSDINSTFEYHVVQGTSNMVL